MTSRSPSRIAGRYDVERTLKHGHGVQTLLARRSEDQVPCVIKIARQSQVPLASRLRLEHEAQVLRTLDSPWIASLLETGTDGDLLFVVTPHVAGTDLRTCLADGPMPLRPALRIIRCLLTALAAAHEQDVVHRDVKPANLVVDGDRAVLVDFGFSRSERLDASLRDLPVGTAAYMAPEQAGMIDAEVDERTDLYAVGAVLFACLTGRPPFPGDSLREVLLAHLTLPPPPLATLGISAPRAVEGMIGHLLAKDPRDRYQSASGALADLDDVIAALEAGDADPDVVIGIRDRRRTLTRPAFVGRQAALTVMTTAVERTRDGLGGLILLEAESGGGKTRLLEECAQRVLRDGVRVLRGQGTDQVAQRPFEVLRGVAAGIVELAREDPSLGDRLAVALGDRRDAVGAALPELGDVLQLGSADAGPEAFGAARTVDALTALLDALGDAEVPALVLLDDCQWADEATIQVIRAVQERRSRADRRADVSVVAAFRSEEVAADHPLRRVTGAQVLRLGPLARPEVRRLLETMAGPLPDEVVDAVADLADGSPFMASAVLHGMVEAGGLVAEHGGWRVQQQQLSAVTASRRAGTILARRLTDLPHASHRLLEVGAVLGKTFSLEFATTLLGQPAAEAGAALQEARRRHLVWVHGDHATFAHDKVREGLLEQVPEDGRRTLHRQAAEWLETHAPDRCFDLAHHWEATGDSARALPYALLAAESARSQHALDSAERQYAIAERGAADADPAVRRAVAEGMGDVLMLRGRYDEAAASLERALDLAVDGLERARIQGKLGELEFKRGDVPSARVAVEAALRLLRCRVPRSGVGFVVALLREVLVQALHTLLPRQFVGRRGEAGPQAEAELVAIRLYSRLAHIYWFGAGRAPCGWAHLREMNLAERYAPTPELAQAYSEHAPVMTMIPWFSRGVAYADRSLQIRRELDDLWGQGQSLHFRGVVLYCSSRFDDCLASLREAVRLLQLTGDQWEVNTASWHIAFALYRQGHLADAVEEARRVHRWGTEIGDPQARGISLAGWSKASGGAVPAELLAAERGRAPDDVHTNAELLQADAVRLLDAGDPAAAIAVLEQARTLVREAGLRQEYVVALLPWLATARRVQLEGRPAWLPHQRRRDLRQARRAARRAVRAARWYRNNLPHALREAGRISAIAGRPDRARRLLARSLQVAEELGMAHERSMTLETRGTLGLDLGWEGHEADARAAVELLARSTAGLVDGDARTVTLSVLDRFEGALESGRRIASALTTEAVHEELLSAARALLRAERCEIVLLRDGQVPEDSGELPVHVSDSLLGAAIEQNRPIAVGGTREDVSESLVLSEVRSALCAPIQVRGALVACLYASHRTVASLFGEDEEQLAAFLTTLAGAALENAQGFAAIEELNQTLEQRVAERTAQLTDANTRLDASLRQLERALAHEKDISERLRRLDGLKDDFLGMVAHDLRSPLTVVHGMARTLQLAWETLDDEQRRLMVDRLLHNTNRLVQFAENLLEFGRIESGQFVYDLQPFELEPLARKCLDDLAIASRPVRVRADLPEGLPTVLGDEQRHWQVLTNLLSNAVKFSPEDGEVTVRARHNGDHVEVSVTDQGPGIPPEDVGKLFRKFGRLEARDGRSRPVGTGLGLYICSSLVSGQGGRIWVDSQPGQGATFNYTVALAPAGDDGSLDPDPPPAAREGSAHIT